MLLHNNNCILVIYFVFSLNKYYIYLKKIVYLVMWYTFGCQIKLVFFCNYLLVGSSWYVLRFFSIN